jgi:hypothetical protein
MSPPSDFATRLRHVRALLADESPVRGALSRFVTGQLGTNRAHFVRALLRGAGGQHSGYDPNQPRVPAGNPDGGQWTSIGGTIRLAMGDTGFLDSGARDAYAPSIDAPIEQAVMSWFERRRLFFGQRDLFGEGGAGGGPWLPPYRGGPTSGVLQTPVTADIQLVSGTGGPASLMPPGARGFDLVTRTHVEGHAVALMWQHRTQQGTLYINNPAICPQCAKKLPSMLPPGATLNVVLPNGSIVRFTGVLP